MRILLAEDETVARRLANRIMLNWGYQVSEAEDGEQAWALLEAEAAPVVILDWLMPQTNGLELCRRIRSSERHKFTYFLLLTGMERTENLLQGLEGADYLQKPVNPGQFKARLHVGERVIGLKQSLLQRLQELEKTMTNAKELSGLLPICSYCRKIRNNQNYWEKLERYITEHTHARFSPGICPKCYQGLINQELQALLQEYPASQP